MGNNYDAGPAVTDKYAPLSLGMPHKSGMDNTRGWKTRQDYHKTLHNQHTTFWLCYGRIINSVTNLKVVR